jgi:hypothetical protein
MLISNKSDTHAVFIEVSNKTVKEIKNSKVKQHLLVTNQRWSISHSCMSILMQ